MSTNSNWIRAGIQAALLAVATGVPVYLWTDEAWVAVISGTVSAVAGHIVVELSLRLVRQRTP